MITANNRSSRFLSLTLICLFSSLSLWASICSLLHSSMIFFTSPSSRVELSDFWGSEEDSDFSKLDDIILLDSMSCCREKLQSSESFNAVRALPVAGRGFASSYLQEETYTSLYAMYKLIHRLTGQSIYLCVGTFHLRVPFISGASCFQSTISPCNKLCAAQSQLGAMCMYRTVQNKLKAATMGPFPAPCDNEASRSSSYHEEAVFVKLQGVWEESQT